jgi:hypothetical protein
MYDLFKTIHHYLFFVVLVLGLFAIAKAVVGMSSKVAYTDGDRKTGLFFLISCHTQLIIGLILYFFLSPLGLQAFQTLGSEVMKNKDYRYMAVEHISANLIAIALITVGYSKNKRSTDSAQRHKNALIFFGLGLALLLSRIPWDRIF